MNGEEKNLNEGFDGGVAAAEGGRWLSFVSLSWKRLGFNLVIWWKLSLCALPPFGAEIGRARLRDAKLFSVGRGIESRDNCSFRSRSGDRRRIVRPTVCE